MSGHAASYGYGMSALIKYLVESQGDAFIFGTYQDVQAGADPWDALQANLSTPLSEIWDAPLQLMAAHAHELAVPGLRDLAAVGTDIMVLVSHHRLAPPYTQTTPLDLRLRVVESDELPGFESGTPNLTYAAQWTNGDVARQNLAISTRDGALVGNTFHAVWDSLDTSNNMRYQGSFTAVLDEGGTSIIDWSAENRWVYPNPDTWNLYQAAGGVLPQTSRTDNSITFSLNGPGTCGSIVSIEVEQVLEGVTTRRLIGFGCNDDSQARITFW